MLHSLRQRRDAVARLRARKAESLDLLMTTADREMFALEIWAHDAELRCLDLQIEEMGEVS